MIYASKITYIYILIDPITNEVKYVGKTDYPNNRLKGHIKDVNRKKCKNQHKKAWIKNLLNLNSPPIFYVVDIVKFEEWTFWEQHYISLYKSWGFNLVNKTNGGDGGGVEHLTTEHKNKIGKALKGRISNRKGAKLTDIQKNEISFRIKNDYAIGKRKPVKHSIEAKKRISEKNKDNYKKGIVDISGKKNGMFGKTKKLYAEGILFNSAKQCAEHFKIHPKTVTYRIKSINFKNYYFAESKKEL